jgi:phage host-nuclease inhibitor protein Gam
LFEDPIGRITRNLAVWEEGLVDPAAAQGKVLRTLLEGYSKTEYGRVHGADGITSIEKYRERFPAVRYRDLEPWFERVRNEGHGVFLDEEPITWVMTRGSTGESKVVPVTPRHLQDLIKCGSRAVLNFSMKHGGLDLLAGGVLNLQFPSNMRVITQGGKEVVYGFSSGTYAKLNPMMAGLALVPRQEDIDALQTDLTPEGWEKRYEFIYQKAKEKDIVSIIGVAPVEMGFARYIKKKHGVAPMDIWKLKVIYSTSVAKIQQEYAPRLRALYGEVPVVELYSATEGAFAQQRDELPYVSPNYDVYLFEVEKGSGVKMLHELKRGEWGRIIISTAMLPRYRIGDLVEAMGKNHFRIFGRDKPEVVLEHMLWKLLVSWAV